MRAEKTFPGGAVRSNIMRENEKYQLDMEKEGE
jgi:hypothetical protein